ncbi:MAG TPA: pyruvate kinase, partial [Dehalococcoidia bacterium]|nr:pyruvate kinase [Dehalococcoidia bacterium]
MRRTKIVGTIGPASASEETLARLIAAGLDVARLNFSHIEDYGPVTDLIALIRRLGREAGRPIGILQDLSGPKIRVGDLAAGQVPLDEGAFITLTTREVPGDATAVSVSYPELPRDVEPGDRIFVDDGTILLQVEEVKGPDVRCRVAVGGVLKPHKGMNLPGVAVSTPAITAKDKRDIAYGVIQGVDFVAMSFVRSAQDVRELRSLLREAQSDAPIVVKIEKPEAVADFDAILHEADAVMIARGDLGVEMPPHEVPIIQKRLIAKSRLAGKPVITATQMLESKTHTPRPTRAEASDVANAILDGTDAVMLSAETAAGRHPLLAVRMMHRIVCAAESAALPI